MAIRMEGRRPEAEAHLVGQGNVLVCHAAHEFVAVWGGRDGHSCIYFLREDRLPKV